MLEAQTVALGFRHLAGTSSQLQFVSCLMGLSRMMNVTVLPSSVSLTLHVAMFLHQTQDQQLARSRI
jgi:hypothetical protein